MKSVLGCESYYGMSKRDFMRLDERGMNTYNSEVVVFSGHGNAGFVICCSHEWIYSEELASMSNTKVVLWATCYSSKDSATSLSMTKASVRAGAKAAVGFPGSILISSEITFADKFTEQLAQGKNVLKAAQVAADSLFLFDSVKDYIIEGDGWVTLTSNEVQNSEESLFGIESNAIIDEFKQLYEYEEIKLCESKYRYYRTIDGLFTNQFIDVENGQIVKITCPLETFNQPVLEAKTFNALISDSSVYQRVQKCKNDSQNDVKTHNVYCLLNGKYTPIEVNYIEDKKSGCLESLCINLNTGEEIAYETISR